MNFFPTLLLACVMAAAAITDMKTRKIPNLLTFPTMLLAFVYHGVTGGLAGLGFSAAGVAVGIGIFLVPYAMGGMGAGDAKLMGAAGAVLGPKGVFIAAIMSILVGLIYGIILLFIHRHYGRSFLRRGWLTVKCFFMTRQLVPIPPDAEEKQPVLSYGVPIALGTMCYMYLKITGSEFIQDLLGFQFSL